jgi:anaerobic magnesium-protoporphyrin IX monomethyl ester cyclase
MNILLTHGYFLEEDAKEQRIMKPYPPLGILYIAAFLEQHGFPTRIFDTTFSSKHELQNHLVSERPDVLGLYTNLMTKVNVIDIIKFVKEHLPKTQVILGGPDVRYNAEKYLQQGASFLVLGEGEQTMLEVVEHIKAGNNTDQVSGLAFLENGKLKMTAEREKLKDLDELPAPAREKIDLGKYLAAWKSRHGKSTISVSTMRGCPYTCKWCSRGVYGLSYRRRSPEKVVEELAAIQQAYTVDSIWFVDDVFTISHKWLENFATALKASSLKISYECITRADRMNERVIALLKETGCFRVWIGAESGSQKVIDLMDRRVDVKQVREMIRLTRSSGIEAGTFIMLGYPGETEKDIKETIHHLKASDPDHYTITVAYPINGTELFQEVESTNMDTLDWSKTTDREIDFKRTYGQHYYQHAVRHVINEVNGKKALDKKQNLRYLKFKLKSLIAQVGMMSSR